GTDAVNGRAVHPPGRGLPAAAIAPENVGEAVAVEVALSDDRPIAARRTGRAAADRGGAVHQPYRDDAAGLLPQDVAHAAAVEVVGAPLLQQDEVLVRPRSPG